LAIFGHRPHGGRTTSEFRQLEPARPPIQAGMNTHVATPIGPIVLAATPAGLTHAGFEDSHPSHESGDPETQRHLDAGRQALLEYFDGTRKQFDDLDLAPEGTAFQRRVWQALRSIPYGQTTSYGRVARHIGRPSAVRAVGLANGRNPLPIFFPCHRVIGSNGRLTGYGGGLDRKAWLLRHEGAF